MKAIVDQEKCIGCGLCADIAPKVFEMGRGKAFGSDAVTADQEGGAREAAAQCPVEAITVV